MAKAAPVVGLDIILQQLGPFGKYNIVNYALLLFPVFLAGMFGSVFVFEAVNINYRCKIDACENTSNENIWTQYAIPQDLNVETNLSKCSRYSYVDGYHLLLDNGTCSSNMFNTSRTEECSSVVYGDHQGSVIEDFDLGCKEYMTTLIGTIHNAGLFLSLPLTGYVSDRFGRKVALSIASLMNCIFGFSRSFSVNYYMMVTFEFLEAGFGAGAYSTAFVFAMELVGPKGRVFGNTLINVIFVFGLMSLSGLSWILQDWRTLLRIIYLPAGLVFFYIWILNESVRWLLSKGRNEEAVAILEKAAKMNKVTLAPHDLAPLQETINLGKGETELKEDISTKNKPSVFMQVIRSSIIRKRLAVCSFLWITCTFVYYGLSINSVRMRGNKYLNFMLVSFIEIPANFTCLAVLDRFGRKKVMITMYMMSAILCISLTFLPKDYPWLAHVFYLSGKFSITVAYSSVYIYVSEVFPTNVRQSLLAVCSSTGRVGSTLAPLTPLLALKNNKLPSIFFGSMAIVAGLLVFTLPETINVPLPDTIEEAEIMSRGRKITLEET